MLSLAERSGPWPGKGAIGGEINDGPVSPCLERFRSQRRGGRPAPATRRAARADRVELLQELLGEAACRRIGIYPIPADFKLSVVIPCYNEERWIRELVRRVQEVAIPKEIVIVDDCSKDGTRAILKELESEEVRVVLQPHNQGKGAALREAFRHCTGDVIVVQDADLEYDPAEYPRLIQPILDNQADVVYGSRFIGDCHRVLYFWHSVANRMLTTLSNMFTNLNLTDMETCYKVFRKEVLADVKLRRTASASSRRSRPRSRARGSRRGAFTRCRSAIPAAPTRRARRSVCGRHQRPVLHHSLPLLQLTRS